MSSRASSVNRNDYARLFRAAISFAVNLPQRQWCNLWHQHFDGKGFGDLNWVHRRRHITVLLKALNRARRELQATKQPHQLFAIVHPQDSSSDAIYVHTPNPYSEFPSAISGSEIHTLPPLLAGRVDQSIYEVLVNRHNDGNTYLIRPRT